MNGKSWSEYAYTPCAKCGHPRIDHLHYEGKCLHENCDCEEFVEPE